MAEPNRPPPQKKNGNIKKADLLLVVPVAEILMIKRVMSQL